MLDRRSVIRREWGYWWRFMGASVAVWAVALATWTALFTISPGSGGLLSPGVLHLLVLNGLLTGVVQLVVAGISCAVLVRVYVRSHHPVVIAAISNGAAILTVFLGGAIVLPELVAATLSLGATAYLRISLVDLYGKDSAHLCRQCFYDLRGLSEQVCPECGAIRS